MIIIDRDVNFYNLIQIPLLLWPIFAFVGSLLCSFLIGLFAPVVYIYDDNVDLFCGGLASTFELAIKCVKGFFKYNWEVDFFSSPLL